MKTTYMSMAVVFIFIVTNLPHMVDAFIRQEILSASCSAPWCEVLQVPHAKLYC